MRGYPLMRTIKTIIIGVLAILMFSCHHEGGKHLSGDLVSIPRSADGSTNKEPVIKFEKTEYDFGKILQGEVVSYTFHFTNVGDAPLLITAVDKSCGCTASEFVREPIAPGGKGQIKITYDSKGHHGIQSKSLVVNANTNPAQTILRIKAEVRTPEQL